MQGRDSEDVWSRFVFELVIWPKEVTLVSRTQPSGPLCLWQCLILCISIRNNWHYVFDLTDETLSWREMLSECICYVAFEPVSLIFDLSFECSSILHARHSQRKILTSSPQINQVWSPNSLLSICKYWRLALINAILISSQKVDGADIFHRVARQEEIGGRRKFC